MKSSLLYKVLIVEDDPAYAKPLHNALSAQEGFEVVGVCSHAKEAWEEIVAKAPDAVIVDLELEAGCGFSLLDEINERREELSVVPYKTVVTGLNSPEALAMARELANYVHKKNHLYSPDDVVKHLRVLSRGFGRKMRKEIAAAETSIKMAKKEILESRDRLIRDKIGRELDKHYVAHGLIGRDYLIEAINVYIDISKRDQVVMTKIYEQLSGIFEKDSGAIEMSVARVIKRIFDENGEHVKKNLDGYLNKRPTNKEFVARIANKVKADVIY